MGLRTKRGAENCFVVLSGDELERGFVNKKGPSYEI